MPRKRRPRSRRPAADPLWYKDAIIYQVHVRSFCDANGDGIGDFRGLASKLDYIESLGVTAIWLLPFYPSPLRDEGYDIADYTDINPDYGTIKDFAAFLSAAHGRGLRVITELVINHTSDQHAWFQRARRAKPGSRARDYYVWSDTPTPYADARIIFKDFEQSNWSYDSVAKAYYWHRFYSHQPDLNFEQPAVRREVFKALDFWCELGVDGFRLDAVPYLYEEEGTDCENLPQTHAFLKELRSHVDQHYPGRMLLAEANQWPEDAAKYLGDGDECNMNFHFPLMPRLFMALQMEDRYPIIDILRQTPEIPENTQWAIFLRNHDELTLEMVTDEERDYMYRAYALDQRARINLGIRRRLAPLLGKNRRAIELMNGLLFSLPGTPVVYYGDELGMGDNIFLGDRNGVRTPMQWSADRNAGFSSANPQSLYLPTIIDPEYHYESINAEGQGSNTNSLLWWMRNAIALRKQHRAFGRGTIEFLEPRNGKVLVFVRAAGDDVVLVVANLSRFAQYVELDLQEWSGARPREMFGGTAFPTIGEQPWLLTLGAHSFYWFHLRSPQAADAPAAAQDELRLSCAKAQDWGTALTGSARAAFEARLLDWLPHQRWFGEKAAELARVEVRESLALPVEGGNALLTILAAHTTDGKAGSWVAPFAFVDAHAAEELAGRAPLAVLSPVRIESGAAEPLRGAIVDALYDPAFRAALLDCAHRRRTVRGSQGTLRGRRSRGQAKLWDGWDPAQSDSRTLGDEQSNSSIVFGEALVMKLYRRVEEGINPDLELGAFLSARGRFRHSPPVAGWLEYERAGRTTNLASIHEFVANEGDAWTWSVEAAALALEKVAANLLDQEPAPPLDGALAGAAQAPPEAFSTSSFFFESVRLLGQRTAEMHRALASDPDSADMRPERFTPFARRALYQSFRNLTKRGFLSMRERIDRIPTELRGQARELLEQEDAILTYVREQLDRRLSSYRTRTHGDFHLGQVLRVGNDFAIIDFEGEPMLPLGERRLKRSPLRDVAGMLRSFHYAALVALRERIAPRVQLSDERAERMRAWAEAWSQWTAGRYLAAYLEHGRDGRALADADDSEIAVLLDVHRLEKAIYELDYELNNRPTWVGIPLAGIREVLRDTLGAHAGGNEKQR